MLVLTRKINDSIVVRPDAGLDPNTTIGELFRDGPLVIHVVGIDGRQAKIGIEAPLTLDVARSELLDRPLALALEAARSR